MNDSVLGYSYDNIFFTYINEQAARSAPTVVSLLAGLLDVSSVLDVGCGRGVWLREWQNQGVGDFVGIDGDYVDDSGLVIPPDRFLKCDLSKPFDLNRRFDLVQSLEVGEHIAEAYADSFVKSLATHGDIILFSAAVPGQGGEFHVNEQPLSYWRDKFAALGFRVFDWLRPRIRRERAISPWYRYNTLLFLRGPALRRLNAELLASEIPHDQPIAMSAPLLWRVRNQIIARLPQPITHRLSILKHWYISNRLALGRYISTTGN
jgi:SAM-dependent methyltransferase